MKNSFSRSKSSLVFAQYGIGLPTVLGSFRLAEITLQRTDKEWWRGEIASKGSTGGNRVGENRKLMTREEFLLAMDEILDLRIGTLRGDEKLEELENWDSTALISLIVLAETNNNAQITPDQVVGCSTVADLLRLAQVEGTTS
jgi:acyl carrier protein